MENNQQIHTGTFLYQIQAKAVLFAVIFSYFLLSVSWLHPFRNCTWYLRSGTEMHVKIQAYVESIWHVWQRVHNEEVRGVFHEYTLVLNETLHIHTHIHTHFPGPPTL